VFTAIATACRSCHILIANQFNSQILPRDGIADQIDYHCVVCQWAATPIERDIAENSALNLIPLASSRREMAGCQPRAQFVSQALQRDLPLSTPARAAPAVIGGNQQFARRHIELRSLMSAPLAQRIRYKRKNKKLFGGDYKITAVCKVRAEYEIGKSGLGHSD